MICTMCCDGRESECWGITKHKTWCDWQGYPHDTVILQSQFCKHLRASETYCPTCGKVFDGENNQVEQPTEEPVVCGIGSSIKCDQCKEDPTKEHNCAVTGQTIEGPDRITSKRRKKASKGKV